MDLVFVTYNSEKWIDGCFGILEKTENRHINIFVADNFSTDSTLEKLNCWKEKFNKKKCGFEILNLDSNRGFGYANNSAAALGTDPYLFFLNIDTQVYEDTFDKLEKELLSSPDDIAMWELRQLPFEHPKVYNPVNGEVSWCSGAAFVIRRAVFELVKGFDDHIFMYGEDVDLSWRVREKGYTLKYIPKVCIQHFSYQYPNEFKKTQFIYGTINNLLLRYRFGTFKDVTKGHLLFMTVIFGRNTKKGLRTELLINYFRHFKKVPYWFRTRCGIRGNFYGWEYEYQRDGAYFFNERARQEDRVSVIVRTCGRPDILRETLLSLAGQTYPNFEIVVIEDGPDISREMIQREFGRLEIKYYSTGNRVGRSRAGNIGLAKATGKYLNFLDDDDLFFYDHIETLVNALTGKSEKAAYSYGLEAAVEINSKSPYVYEIKRVKKRYAQPFDKLMLCHHNYIPIQCMMFEKSLFDNSGGLDEGFDYLEDWDLWVRYATETDFLSVPKTTSIYKVPFNSQISRDRQKLLDEALLEMREKHKNYYIKVSVNKVAKLWKQKGVWRR